MAQALTSVEETTIRGWRGVDLFLVRRLSHWLEGQERNNIPIESHWMIILSFLQILWITLW